MPKILVADDNASIRRVICHFLKQKGFDTVEARHGGQVFEILETFQPDAILLDVMMPQMDGFTVCKTLKAHPKWKTIPVIMLTAKDLKSDVLKALTAGADDYLLKPFKNELVLARLQKVLDARPAPPPPTPVTERREASRRAVVGTVSWSAPGAAGTPTSFKNKILDLSRKGVAVEFDRCGLCTGYQQGAVHPLCLLAPQAFHIDASSPVVLKIEVDGKKPFETSAKVAHVFQPTGTPKTEVVGFAFIDLSDEARKTMDAPAS